LDPVASRGEGQRDFAAQSTIRSQQKNSHDEISGSKSEFAMSDTCTSKPPSQCPKGGRKKKKEVLVDKVGGGL
jgi:hypothetical protein